MDMGLKIDFNDWWKSAVIRIVSKEMVRYERAGVWESLEVLELIDSLLLALYPPDGRDNPGTNGTKSEPGQKP